MPAFGVMGWAMPRVLCEALLARLARFLIILLQDALAPITSPFWRSPERSGRGISRYVRGICFSPCLPSTHPPATQKSATTLVKRHLVCKRWTIEKADENSNGTPWFVLHRPNSDKLRFHLPSLPWHWFDA